MRNLFLPTDPWRRMERRMRKMRRRKEVTLMDGKDFTPRFREVLACDAVGKMSSRIFPVFCKLLFNVGLLIAGCGTFSSQLCPGGWREDAEDEAEEGGDVDEWKGISLPDSGRSSPATLSEKFLLGFFQFSANCSLMSLLIGGAGEKKDNREK
ncbi:hypothetical protein CEXT_748531 [Caerostris extrusa]|uniref:Uncharacterized protein n=1 Tax=Caerostris extrusa TaxID=172846 RepID=A0AAV4N7U6_CAEEX|nr:hypothetical protein CEXT_748531 [Caerostris extrusa]